MATAMAADRLQEAVQLPLCRTGLYPGRLCETGLDLLKQRLQGDHPWYAVLSAPVRYRLCTCTCSSRILHDTDTSEACREIEVCQDPQCAQGTGPDLEKGSGHAQDLVIGPGPDLDQGEGCLDKADFSGAWSCLYY